jgi:hypothetical protein
MRRERRRASAREAPMATDYLLFAIPLACLLAGIVFRAAFRGRDGRPPRKR